MPHCLHVHSLLPTKLILWVPSCWKSHSKLVLLVRLAAAAPVGSLADVILRCFCHSAAKSFIDIDALVTLIGDKTFKLTKVYLLTVWLLIFYMHQID